MTWIRRIGAVVLAAPLAMSVPILGTAVPAHAASAGITSPGDGAVISSGGSVSVSATTEWFAWRLVVVSPGGNEQVVDAKEGVNTESLNGTAELGDNGRYEVRLQKKGLVSWSTKATRAFYARVPPAAPGGLSATVSGSKITVRWNRGLENDLTGYSISAGSVGSKSGSVGGLCSGTSCSTTFSVPSGTSGAIPVRVRAKRSNGSGGSVYSGTASASVTVKGSSGGSGGGSNSSAPSSSVPSMPGNTPRGTAPLTPFNNASPVTLPSVQPDGAPPGLAYPTPQVADQSRPKAQNVAAPDSLQWGKSVAIALILLVVAAHLGTWTRRMRVANAGISSQGMAARIARGGSGRKRVVKARKQIARAEAVARTADLSSIAKAAKATPTSKGKSAPSRSGKATSRAGRRPATLGGSRTSGVTVRIAKPSRQPGKRRAGGSRQGGRRRAK
ncbi:fibronectin type III domain-containing protein [Actinomadura miaoliensis]|uniref:Fibronectin type-III domain-containing protein n=1 Tax=Actinomadura miaoliensis TaxID=430685 RepID=A0ABP7WDX0_9ACTN